MLAKNAGLESRGTLIEEYLNVLVEAMSLKNL